MNELGTKPNIPDHELLRLIGRGSYGEVWLARNIMGTLRAVKIVYRSAFDHARPYEREFSGLQKFEPISRTHASQLDILHIGQNHGEGYFYYVMELADNAANGARSSSTAETSNPPEPSLKPEQFTRSSASAIVADFAPQAYLPKTLKSEMDRRGPLAPRECIELGLSLSTAIAHLHKNDLVHRDIKPSNIIFVNSQVKLADIGLVSAVDATRSYVGTVGYAPYEGPGTPQADIYSLGKVLYEAATGRDRQEFPELPTQISGTAEQQQQFLELNEVLIKACDEDPRRRYQTAEQMHEDLLALRSGESLVRLRTVERRFQWARRVGVAALLLVVLITPAYLYEARQTRRVMNLAAQNLLLAQEARSRAEEARRNELTARENLYATDISLAHQALQADNLRQALDLLKKQIPKPGDPDLRGFEWRYLWQQCQGEELFSLPGHKDAVESVAFSPDGKRLATASRDKTVKIWDLASRQQVAVLTNHAEPVLSVAWSPDCGALATASPNSVCLWDTGAFQLVRTLPGSMFKARFSPNGAFLIAATTNGLVLWDTQTWNSVSRVQLPGVVAGFRKYGVEFGFSFSPDNRRLAAAFDDGIELLRLPALQDTAALPDSIPHARPIAFSPTGDKIAAASQGYSVKLWETDGQNSNQLSGHSDSVDGLAFSPDGKTLATCSTDQTIKLWDVVSGKLQRTFKGHAEEVWDIAFSPDGKFLASGSKDGAVKIWDPLAAPKLEADIASFMPIGFDPMGNLVGFLKEWGLSICDPVTLQKLSVPNLDTRHDSNLIILGNLADDGRTLTLPSAQPDDTLSDVAEVWDLQQRQFLCEVQNRSEKVAFAPSSHLLATSTKESSLPCVTLWQLPSGSRRCILSNSTAPVGFSADERLLATVSSDVGKVCIWKLENTQGNLSANVCSKIDIQQMPVALSPDGHMLACGGWGGFVRLFDVKSGQEIATLVGHKRDVNELCFSPDSRTLATCSDDATVRFWNVKTRRELMIFQTGTELAEADLSDKPNMKFSADGRTLVALLADSKVFRTRLWRAPTFTEIAVAEGLNYHTEIGQDPALRLATGKALLSHHRESEALEVFSGLIRFCGDQPDLQPFRTSALRQRAELLSTQGRFAEAGEDNCAALNISARAATLPAAFVDLSPHFNRSLDEDPFDLNPILAAFPTLPRGRQALPGCCGIEFDIRGSLHLDRKDGGAIFPKTAEGIRVQQKCRRLHFLQSTTYSEQEDTLVATYIVHYADGETEEIPVCYGQHVRDWNTSADPVDAYGTKPAWSGAHPTLGAVRIFLQTWENPRPETEIRSLDFVSKLTKCGPFLLAITAQ